MHDFRRSCAHELFKAGSTYKECREVTGHATDSMFKRYADLFSEDERRAIQLKVQERRQSWRTEEFTAMATPATLSN
jgi:integrase